MPTPPNMLRVRTRGITRLSWSMTKVRKLELTGTRPDLQVFGVRLTDRAYAAGERWQAQAPRPSLSYGLIRGNRVGNENRPALVRSPPGTSSAYHRPEASSAC